MFKLLTDEMLSDTLQAFIENDRNQVKTAAALNISRSTLQNRLTQATKRGMAETMLTPPLPEGMELDRTTTLYDADGQAKLQWVRAKMDRSLEDVLALITDTLSEFDGRALVLPYVPAPPQDEDLLTVYPIADLHLGQYSWAEETGADYDLEHATRILTKAMEELVSRSPSSGTALILNLGDFFHSDSNENRTRRSGNVLDVDTRYAKVLRAGVTVFITVIQLALQKHKRVIVRNLPGNHDPYAALALTLALSTYFSGSARVEVDESPDPFFWFRWGKTLLGATHGDMAKAEDMPGIMAAMVPKEWGQTEYRYVYTGHLHTAKKALISERAGAQVEVFQTLAAKDAWSHSMGFTSVRSMQSITHDKEHGEIVRLTVTTRGEK